MIIEADRQQLESISIHLLLNKTAIHTPYKHIKDDILHSAADLYSSVIVINIYVALKQ